ncbi:uncharacterized protein SPAPADRAFT_58599, partial [Spathaspora passalidarum NRRL Y-27907]
MDELIEDNFRRLGGIPGKNGRYLSAGDIVGKLNAEAAEELGLTTECIVGSPVIDAYAGWVGTVAAQADITKLQQTEVPGKIITACGRLAAVAGTSTCHIAMTKEPCFVQGVWGPYKDVMAEGYWLAEGGQSCTGQLLAHVLSIHPASQELSRAAEASNLSKFDYLNLTLENLVLERNERSVVSLAKHMFFYGDFHGNRSPIADPRMKANIIGQSMDSSVKDLAIQYFAACEFIAQQTRQIVEEMEKSGHDISCIFMSGGQCRNGLLMRLLADCTGLPIVIPRYIDAAVVFGAALLGAAAAEDSVKEYSLTKGRSRRESTLADKKKSQVSLHTYDDIASPYTQPSATSTTNLATLAYAGGSHSHLAQEVDYFNQPTAGSPLAKVSSSAIHDSENEESDDETLSFGSKHKVQQGLSQELHKMKLTKLTSINEQKAEDSTHADKLWKIMEKMTGPGKVIYPSEDNDPDRKLLATKYKVFLDQCFKQQEYRRMVDEIEKENL